MAPGYALSGICNPMYGLGTLGLGASGMYGSYDPYMMGMSGGYGMGGYGNYSNIFNMYQTMQDAQQNMEISRANHTSVMNAIMGNNEVDAVDNAHSTLVRKILSDSSVMSLVGNLVDKVHKGELDGVCNQYDDLKHQIFATYRDEIAERGEKENPDIAVRELIDTLYSKKLEASGYPKASLRDDIKQYGESPFMNGLMQASHSGHDKKYVDEALYHIYHEDISNIGSNEKKRSLGMMSGGACKYIKDGAVAGAITGATVTAAGVTLRSLGAVFPEKTAKWPVIAQLKGVKPLHWAGKGLGIGLAVTTIIGFGGIIKSLFDGGKHYVQAQYS